jgi:hypothetical protein
LSIADDSLRLFDVFGKVVVALPQLHLGDSYALRVEGRRDLRFVTEQPQAVGERIEIRIRQIVQSLQVERPSTGRGTPLLEQRLDPKDGGWFILANRE